MPLINFIYPVTNFKEKYHVCDLNIYAICVLRSDKSIAGVQVMKVMHENVNVLRLIEAVSPDEWADIKAAALSHAEGEFGAKEESIIESLYKIIEPKESNHF